MNNITPGRPSGSFTQASYRKRESHTYELTPSEPRHSHVESQRSARLLVLGDAEVDVDVRRDAEAITILVRVPLCLPLTVLPAKNVNLSDNICRYIFGGPSNPVLTVLH